MAFCIIDTLCENWVLVFITILALLLTVVYWKLMAYNETPIVYPISLDNQSQEIEPGVRGSWLMKDGKLLEYYFDDVKTTHEALLRGIRISNNGNFLGTRTKTCKQYQWMTYQEVYDKAHQLGSAFVLNGLKAIDETFIGIYSSNNPEWVISAEACAMFSMAIVPLYDTLGADACQYIITQTSMELVICEDLKRVKLILDSCSEKTSIKYIVVIKSDDTLAAIKTQGENMNVKVSLFEEMMVIGKENLQKLVPAKPETINVISYTSGTTGNPKGVIITHKSMVCNLSGILAHNSQLCKITNEDVHLSYLPLAHMFERLNHTMMICHGARIGFSCGDIRLIMDDLQILGPTIFPTVPRLLNRLYDKVLQFIGKNKYKKAIFDFAVNQKINLLKKGIVTRNTIWDYLFFRKIQNMMGGRIKVCVTGSAPCSPPVLNFVRAAFGCNVFEGYGQTEVTACTNMTCPHEYEAGVVGPPISCCIIKLIDIPDMEYYAKDGKGEVCVKSSSIMSGYYKEPEKTAETITADGWVLTGDIGLWLPNGSLKIIDRRKHIFKLSQGEYLAPEKIEAVYLRSPFIVQIFVDGSSLQTFPLAIVVPDEIYVAKWNRKTYHSDLPIDKLCLQPDVKKAILEDLNKHGKEGGLKGFELVKDIFVCMIPFSVKDGLLTPTLKSKRPALRKRFQKEFEDMYAANA